MRLEAIAACALVLLPASGFAEDAPPTPKLVTLVSDTGDRFAIEPGSVVRIRGTTDSEQTLHPGAATLIDYVVTVYSRDRPEAVVALIVSGDTGTKIGRLTLPNGLPLWFDGRRAQGPLPIPPDYRRHGINSALNIAGRIQFVRSAPAEVFNVLTAIKGGALPFTQSPQGANGADAARKALAGKPKWDDTVPELSLPQATP